MYIYAFPIQQSIAALIPGVSVLSMWFISTTVTFVLAALSWHFVEKQALRFKERYANYINSLPSLGLAWVRQR
jgi:peptidoglycan/LPS O-acetylase OafA/YrhL